jgi:ribosome-associated translation inhibitor RaiA
MQLEATMTEIIEGPIAAVDRVYAFDAIRRICEAAPRAVQRVRARLTAEPHPTGDCRATAECWLLLEGGLIICAGTAASSMRRAIDALMARLRRRLDVLGSRESSQRIETLPATATSSVSLTSARTVSVHSPGIGRLTPDAM